MQMASMTSVCTLGNEGTRCFGFCSACRDIIKIVLVACVSALGCMNTITQMLRFLFLRVFVGAQACGVGVL